MEELPAFESFAKIPRLRREIVVTEKIDGTNGQVLVTEDGRVFAGSRNRWLTEDKDNYDFGAWVRANENELRKLGPGRHFGEWWGSSIARRYNLFSERRWSLFNTYRWTDERPACCHMVPILYKGVFDAKAIEECVQRLRADGSVASPGFMKPEGIVVYHTVGHHYYKQLLENDDIAKSEAA